MKDTPHADVFNNQIKVGDFVIYAASLGRCSILKVAIVLELREKKYSYYKDEVAYKVSVRTAHREGDWKKGRDHYKWTLQKKGSPITLEFTERMVKVDPKTLPLEVRNLLKKPQ